jgi:hypothetical protein
MSDGRGPVFALRASPRHAEGERQKTDDRYRCLQCGDWKKLGVQGRRRMIDAVGF